MVKKMVLLGVDGGGTSCRARLADFEGKVLGEGLSGPANIRFGLSDSFAAVADAAKQCLDQAGLDGADLDIVACLALAGASEPMHLAAARTHAHPFLRVLLTTDAHAACVGAHGGTPGGIIIVGTGSVGWAVVDGEEHRIGGWGFPISDEGSGAWLGCEAARRVLWAHDGKMAWSPLLKTLYARFGSDPHAIVRWMGKAHPRDFAELAPAVLEHAKRDDVAACELMRLAAGHIDTIAARLTALGVTRIALTGGIAEGIEPWLAQDTRVRLVVPKGDALSGALRLAREEAETFLLSQRKSARG
jgi:glucosamine kinase